MNSSVLASIIIPAYNVEKYIGECLDSVLLHQKLTYDIEIIVVDDGSNDKTADVLKKYQHEYGITVITQKNLGQAAARNNGIKASHGKYLLFLDSDDYFVADALNNLLIFLAGTNFDLVEYDYMEHNEKTGDETCCPLEYAFMEGETGQAAFASQVKNSSYRPLVWTKAVLRKMLQDNDIYFLPGIFHEDEEWCPKIYAYAKTVSYFPERVYAYRTRREGSVMYKMRLKNCRDLLTVINSLEQFTLNKMLTSEYVSALRCVMSANYMGVVSMLKCGGVYDDEVTAALERKKYVLRYSYKRHRKYIYYLIICLVGVKNFYRFKYHG